MPSSESGGARGLFSVGGGGGVVGLGGGYFSKKLPGSGGAGPLSVRSESNISNINGLEDPFSDAGAYTPVAADNRGMMPGDKRDSFGGILTQ